MLSEQAAEAGKLLAEMVCGEHLAGQVHRVVLAVVVALMALVPMLQRKALQAHRPPQILEGGLLVLAPISEVQQPEAQVAADIA